MIYQTSLYANSGEIHTYNDLEIIAGRIGNELTINLGRPIAEEVGPGGDDLLFTIGKTSPGEPASEVWVMGKPCERGSRVTLAIPEHVLGREPYDVSVYQDRRLRTRAVGAQVTSIFPATFGFIPSSSEAEEPPGFIVNHDTAACSYLRRLGRQLISGFKPDGSIEISNCGLAVVTCLRDSLRIARAVE